ncbi:uncharacterized protein F5891DRAFT_1175932 [Suillus fuscotomentosus]|uniref:LysM domain-containing protein n=1 Tax=Suillus fuscotomentosus TaxID=1912939 RepID=A0AAD4DY41_9AGAM|nr:uncharacterized protein F5891DRAFT_1175932 [Suillus fuscotomentosus]KAG1894768.1 hypothetical protein F5891DRAFT_1175932 [Suillus fuscotomentosus]
MHASFFAARLVVLAAIALVVSAQSLLPENCDRSVTLAAVNSKVIDRGCDNLAIGEVLCLGIKGQDCKVTQVLKGGETCHDIAKAAGITEKTLLANNPNLGSDCSKYTGELERLTDLAYGLIAQLSGGPITVKLVLSQSARDCAMFIYPVPQQIVF